MNDMVSDGMVLDVTDYGGSGFLFAVHLDGQDSVAAALGECVDEVGGVELEGDGIEVSAIDVGGGYTLAAEESGLFAQGFTNIYGQL